MNKPLETNLLDMDAEVIDAVRIYSVRYSMYTVPSVYKQFFQSPLDARFNRVWGRSVLGYTQNDAAHYKTPFFFTVTGNANVSSSDMIEQQPSLQLFSTKLETLAPSFHFNIGNLVGAKDRSEVETAMDVLRSSLMGFDEAKPIVSIAGENDIGANAEYLSEFESKFGPHNGFSFW